MRAVGERNTWYNRRVRLVGVRVLDRYLITELVSPFLFGVALFTFFLVIDRIYNLTNLVVTKGVPFRLVLELLGLMLPSFLAFTLPMALLVAVLLAGGRLAGDLEIIAFKAAGVSVMRMFRPVLAAALFVTLGTAALTLVVNPLANQHLQRQLFRILQSRATSGLQERVFNTTFGNVIIYVEEVSTSQVALRGMLVSDTRDPKVSRIITAREGRLLTDEAQRRITLRLINGAVNEADIAQAVPEAVIKQGNVFGGGAASARRYRYTNFKVYDMSLSFDSAMQNAMRGVDKPERDLGLADLDARIRALAADAHERAPYEVEWHKRLAFPMAAMVFALIGFPLAVRSHRGGRAVALTGSLTILVFYYLVMTSLENIALSGRLPVAIAIWLPNAIFGASGLVLLIATAREWRLPRTTFVWRAVDALVGMVRVWWPAAGTQRVRKATIARDSSRILDRYLVREYVTFLAIGLAVAATLFIVIDLLQTLDRYLRAKPPLAYILEHFVYRLPAALHDTLPIVMLVATIFLFLTLSRSHELTAMKAAGISLYRVSAPILLVGFGMALGAGLFQELLLPHLNELGEEVDQVKIRGHRPRNLETQQRLWLRASASRFYRVELLNPSTNDMYGVTILDLDRGFRLKDRLDARQAHWTPAGWELEDGAWREIGPSGNVTTVPFGHIPLTLQEQFDDFMQGQKPIEAMSYSELHDYINRLAATGFSAKKYLVELYSKLSFPLVNVVMVLVAIPFALHSPRGGRIFGIGLAIAIMAGYLVVHYVALAFARAELLPPFLAAWTANIIFFGLGTSLFLRART